MGDTVKRMTAVWAVFLAAALAWGCGAGKEGKGPSATITLTLANNHPDDYCTTKAVEWFADTVRERTEGRVVIEVYNNGKLGDTVSCLEQMQYGGIDIQINLKEEGFSGDVRGAYIGEMFYVADKDKINAYHIKNGFAKTGELHFTS